MYLEYKDLILAMIKISGVMFMLMNIAAVGVYAERRISAFIQDRLGPNRVGPFGLLQSVADLIKMVFKEDLIPDNVNKVLFFCGPLLAFAPAFITFAVIPYGTLSFTDAVGGNLAIANVGVGMLFIFAVGSLNAYGLAYGGWASNNKYSLMGGIRSSAQIISFEIAMMLAFITVVMATGTVHTNEIVVFQAKPLNIFGVELGFLPNWLCFKQPLAFIIFVVTAFAETNRLPFDMPEAEPELVGGYHTEYSSMKFLMFMLGEYVAMITMSGVIVTLFLGGWHLPGMEAMLTAIGYNNAIGIGVASTFAFLGKVSLLLFIFMWVRWSLPRVRWDQLMKLGWGSLIPLALLNIVIYTIIEAFSKLN